MSIAGKRPLFLAILDGWGVAPPSPSNAISLASTPNMDKWSKLPLTSQLVASGREVGLSDGVAGNSEVGHLNIGAGYVVPQSEIRISQSIQDGSFFQSRQLLRIKEQLPRGGSLHIMGLAGPGLVHSNIEHLWALLNFTNKHKLSAYVHLFSDGRDASPEWMLKNAEGIQSRIEKNGAVLASLCGRYFAMDRDNRWERTEQAYRLLTAKKGKRSADLQSAVESSYNQGQTDEFILPTVIGNGRQIKDGDVVLFYNYRPDRARQLTQIFCQTDFDQFDISNRPEVLFYSMTEYQPGLPVAGVLFEPQVVKEPLASVLSTNGLSQLHAAESEKYAHVTYFLNGGREKPFPDEERLLVPSAKVATYDLKPEMSANQLTNEVIEKAKSGSFDVVIINYANADMVAHTGNLKATIKALETVDSCLGQLFSYIDSIDGVLAITADHGNAEVLLTESGQMDTQHNSGLVPFMIIGSGLEGRLENGVLANVSPTLLDILGIKPPTTMTAQSLWKRG